MSGRDDEYKKLTHFRDEFLKTISHDLRIPLAIIKESINLILDRVPGEINENQEKLLTTARNNVNKAAKILDDLIDMVK